MARTGSLYFSPYAYTIIIFLQRPIVLLWCLENDEINKKKTKNLSHDYRCPFQKLMYQSNCALRRNCFDSVPEIRTISRCSPLVKRLHQSKSVGGTLALCSESKRKAIKGGRICTLPTSISAVLLHYSDHCPLICEKYTGTPQKKARVHQCNSGQSETAPFTWISPP